MFDLDSVDFHWAPKVTWTFGNPIGLDPSSVPTTDRDEFKEAFLAMNLARPTQGHYATRSSCTRYIIAHQCGVCQVAFKFKSNLKAHKNEHHNKKTT
jgi:hypothetical protein